MSKNPQCMMVRVELRTPTCSWGLDRWEGWREVRQLQRLGVGAEKAGVSGGR